MRFKTSGDQGGLFDYQERKAELSQRSTPLDRLNERVDWEKKPSKKAQKDVDARWASKNKEQHFGYKNHVKCNANSKLIEK